MLDSKHPIFGWMKGGIAISVSPKRSMYRILNLEFSVHVVYQEAHIIYKLHRMSFTIPIIIYLFLSNRG